MKRFFLFIILLIITQSCGIYSFTGAKIPEGTETFQLNYFQNNAAIIEPGIERDFTLKLQDLIQNQSSLSLTTTNGDLLYEGEITEYRIAPMTATAQQTAAQNRLTIAVNVRYFNRKNEEDDFEQRFSFYYDYPAAQQLVGGTLDAALAEIFERITQDIFNASLAKW
jgi:hypothetical protein